MARAELTFLNQREEDLIHQQSIETLEKIWRRPPRNSLCVRGIRSGICRCRPIPTRT
jgi:hypothetical protein